MSLSFPQGINRGNVSLINSTVLDVAGNDGGSININAQNIEINDSQVLAGIREGNGFENAQAGDIKLDVTETLEVENSFILNDVNSNAVGNSGGILIDTSTLSLTKGGEISARTDGEGDAGLVQVTASEGITLDGERRSNGLPSRIRSRVDDDGEGNSGGILIDTSTLSLTKGGEISARTDGKGDAGGVQVTASEGITLDGERSNGLPSRIRNQVASDAVGKSGGILIDTSTLSLTKGGRILAITFGEEDAGLVQINATEGITIDGERSDGRAASIIFSVVATGAVGNSEGIVIDTTTTLSILK